MQIIVRFHYSNSKISINNNGWLITLTVQITWTMLSLCSLCTNNALPHRATTPRFRFRFGGWDPGFWLFKRVLTDVSCHSCELSSARFDVNVIETYKPRFPFLNPQCNQCHIVGTFCPVSPRRSSLWTDNLGIELLVSVRKLVSQTATKGAFVSNGRSRTEKRGFHLRQWHQLDQRLDKHPRDASRNPASSLGQVRSCGSRRTIRIDRAGETWRLISWRWCFISNHMLTCAQVSSLKGSWSHWWETYSLERSTLYTAGSNLTFQVWLLG